MKKKKKIVVAIAAIIIILSIGVASFCGVAVAMIGNGAVFEEDERLFEAAKVGTVTRFYANDGAVGGEYIPVEISTMTMSDKIKCYYSIDEMSRYITEGVVAVEDREFYEHDGVNFRRTIMAMFNHIFRLGNSFGASTITQQVIKNISGDNEPTVKRKITEIFRALRIEETHTKNEILELYLNILPLGENVFGVGMGALHYFGKEPSELSADEAAVLIALANAPTLYNPHNNPEKCIVKRNTILRVMEDVGVIASEEYAQAVEQGLNVTLNQTSDVGVYSWFVETVIKDVSRDYAKMSGISERAARLMILAGGYSIYTTQSIDVQRALDEYFSDSENFPDEVNRGLDFSMVISDSKSADLLAIVGSVGEKRANLITNQATELHTPASTLKPLALYAPLIDSGDISWSTVFDDVPLEFIDNFRPYPANSPNEYSGLITVKDAVALSKNTVAMRLYEILGAERIYNNLKNNFGFDIVRGQYGSNGKKITDLAPSPLALGQLSRGIGLRDLTEAYTVFPAGGVLNKGRSYIKIVDANGKTVMDKQQEGKRVFKTETAQIMNQLLMNVTDNGTARIVTLGSFVDTAGKTGTSGGNLEKLFIGYTPYLTGGIRCSYNDSKTAVSGISKNHLEIWDEIMTDLHENIIGKYGESLDNFSIEKLEYLPYCKDSGELFSESCMLDPRGDRIEYGYFAGENKPHQLCKTHIEVYYDIETEAIAHEGCPADSTIKIALINVPWRRFPCEIVISDADYVYRSMKEGEELGDSFDIPYFQNTLPPETYVGKGRKKRQFNHACYLHD